MKKLDKELINLLKISLVLNILLFVVVVILLLIIKGLPNLG